MTQNEKELIVNKITKYDEEKDKANGDIKTSLITTGLGAIATAGILMQSLPLESVANYISAFIGIIPAVGGLLGLYGIIKYILKKAGFSNKIDELNEIMQELENLNKDDEVMKK